MSCKIYDYFLEIIWEFTVCQVNLQLNLKSNLSKDFFKTILQIDGMLDINELENGSNIL